MLNIYKPNGKTIDLISLDELAPGCWLNLVNPTQAEVALFSSKINMPEYLVAAALDDEEPSRISIDDEAVLIVTNIPIREAAHSFNTIPLGIIITQDYFVTVCLEETKILQDFKPQQIKTFEHLMFEIFYRSAQSYLNDLRQITEDVTGIEASLKKSMKNKAIFDLLQLQKSLVYFTTALKDNANTVQKLYRLKREATVQSVLKFDEESEDLLEDVLVEYRQAIETVEMHSNVLSSMMDAFTSIISNNLNIVMKFLTSMTILLAIPTMISSFWGMNVEVPGEGHVQGFYFVTSGALLVMGIAATVLWKKDMF